jgi:hypothetical protein
MTDRQLREMTPIHLRALVGLAMLGLWLVAAATPAAAKGPPPAGRNYFTTSLSLPDLFGVDSGCLRFWAKRVCFDSLDPTNPLFCGTWTLTDAGEENGKQEREVAIDLEWNASGIILGIDGTLRVDDRGRGSSLGGAVRLHADQAGLEVNGSLSGTETSRRICRSLAREFKQVAHEWTAMQCRKGAVFRSAGEALYVLPYPVGESYMLGQSYCEPTGSHRGSYAYDIVMPIGSPIVAARAGVVWMVTDDFEDGDTGPEHANDLFIEHPDGTVAQYAHLQHRSFLVQPGDRVTAGQPVAASGDTGAGAIPHLHFEVYNSTDEFASLPVSFRNAGGTLEERGGLIVGETYEALPW